MFCADSLFVSSNQDISHHFFGNPNDPFNVLDNDSIFHHQPNLHTLLSGNSGEGRFNISDDGDGRPCLPFFLDRVEGNSGVGPQEESRLKSAIVACDAVLVTHIIVGIIVLVAAACLAFAAMLTPSITFSLAKAVAIAGGTATGLGISLGIGLSYLDKKV